MTPSCSWPAGVTCGSRHRPICAAPPCTNSRLGNPRAPANRRLLRVTMPGENDTGVDAAVAADAARYEEAFKADREASTPPAGDQADTGTDDAADQTADEGEEGAARKVPLALEELEERSRQKSAALRQERQLRRATEQRLAQLEAQQQQRQAPQDVGERPDPAVDPLGYLQYVEKRMAAADQQSEQARTQQAQFQAQQRAVNDIVTRASEAETDFAETNPDYYDAVAHLKAGRAKEYEALGLSPAEAAQRVDAEAVQTAHEMLSRGQDPAKGWYELAKTRGFTGKGPSRIDTIREGQKAAASLSNGGGRGSNQVDASSVANLKGAAFDQAFEKLRDAARSAERRTGW